MVSPDVDRAVDPGKRSGAIMVEPTGLAMDGNPRPDDLATGLRDDGLMPKADAKKWNPPRRKRDQFEAATGILGPAGTGREDNQGAIPQSPIEHVRRPRAVSKNRNLASQPLECIDQVEGEAIEIVDQDDVAAHAASGGQSTESNADAFRLVSSASACGMLSWTTPAPART